MVGAGVVEYLAASGRALIRQRRSRCGCIGYQRSIADAIVALGPKVVRQRRGVTVGARGNQRNEPQCYPCRDQPACREMAVLFQHHRVWPSAVEARHPRRRARRPKALGIAIPDKLLALADEVIE